MSNSNFVIIPEKGDERGSVFCGKLDGDQQFLLVEIKKGKRRGGHYHNIDTFHFVVIGSVRYFEKHLDSNGNEILGENELEKSVSGGTVISTPAFTAHFVEAVEDSVILESLPKEKLTYSYSPYRKLVA